VSLLRHVPVWFWVILALVAAIVLDRWSLTSQLDALRAQQDQQVEVASKAAKAAAQAGIADLDRRAARLEANIGRIEVQARATDEKLRQAGAQLAQTRRTFEVLAATGTAPEVVEQARALGYEAVPARRPR